MTRTYQPLADIRRDEDARSWRPQDPEAHDRALRAAGVATDRPAQASRAPMGLDTNLAGDRALGAFHAATAPVQRKGLEEAPDEGEAEAVSQEAHAAPSATAPETTHQLPADLRARMEAAFEADFSQVRIHEGAAAQQLGARAFTQGQDIYFAPGQYDPGSAAGQQLIAHELTHVVQQAQGRVQATAQGKGVSVNEDESLEAEADELGARAVRGEVVGAGAAGVRTAPASAVAGPMQFNGFETLDAAIDALGDASIKHILAAKHAWNLVLPDFKAPAGEKADDVIPDGSWDGVKAILKRVAADGSETKYKSVWQKTLEVGGQTVALTYVKIKGGFRVSDAWVQTR